jgi:hypothetical protein
MGVDLFGHDGLVRPVLATLALLAAGGAVPAAAATAPNVRIVSMRPLVAIGSHFHGDERVQVRFAGAQTVLVSVRTTAAGNFRAAAGRAVDPCLGPIRVTARGRLGDRALAKVPARECPPDNP